MWITRARHESEIRLLQEKQQILQEGYERQVAGLQEQIKDLRSLVFSPTRANDIPAVQAEADSILTQNTESPPEYDADAAEVLRERDRIFSGEYEVALEQ